MSEKQAVLLVQQALRKCFQVISQQEAVWQSTLSECSPLLHSLGNLGEQLQSCNTVALKKTPLKDFLDLEQCLKHKLIMAMECVLEKLSGKMAFLQKVRDTITNQVATVFQLYEQHTGALELSTITERSAVTPSLANMMEWLQDIERFYRQEYLKRKLLLQAIRDDDLSYIQALPESWNRVLEEKKQDLVQDILLKVSFFMETP
ncbi:AFG2-interacting ribosome maturation factor [Latimeria chalumnae]|uniref:AFG2-interacting ribosome maturation factor n=1 Tax=Latimeria chalumnae TaxID=7897 RepID=UPI0003C12A1D|nr:PREDICTED: uncharacterized protein C1orf109 homolog [Latimeria chalumnae]XP_005995631.1 PREDICTED: uncharacterized protein C1orf109 homolog [Latimeria chalumnae]|eukprot:XP_005995630.1 PREDICTED: uncharacterized protein C1orf109 homolog [Latimeria chalumnae]